MSNKQIIIRLIMPDRWLEHVVELATETTVAEAKALGITEMLQRSSDNPADFYAEFAEREITDETQTLDEVGLQSRGMIAIRAYDLGHYRRFKG
tara:strand:+ start:539 stop:820 length:282 start_codon:yes stop_codon:yes gene_type:complete